MPGFRLLLLVRLEDLLSRRVPNHLKSRIDTEQIALDAIAAAYSQPHTQRSGEISFGLVLKIGKDMFLNALRNEQTSKRGGRSVRVRSLNHSSDIVVDRVLGQQQLVCDDSVRRLRMLLNGNELDVLEQRLIGSSDAEISNLLQLSTTQVKIIRRTIRDIALQLGLGHTDINPSTHQPKWQQLRTSKIFLQNTVLTVTKWWSRLCGNSKILFF